MNWCKLVYCVCFLCTFRETGSPMCTKAQRKMRVLKLRCSHTAKQKHPLRDRSLWNCSILNLALPANTNITSKAGNSPHYTVVQYL